MAWRKGKLPDGLAELVYQADDLALIDVSDADKAASRNGHAYFRNSPWVSSDILSNLMCDLSPEERGLTHSKEWSIWQFPPDYIVRLTDKLIERNPTLAPLSKQKAE